MIYLILIYIPILKQINYLFLHIDVDIKRSMVGTHKRKIISNTNLVLPLRIKAMKIRCVYVKQDSI
jgi:hypothetical protein